MSGSPILDEAGGTRRYRSPGLAAVKEREANRVAGNTSMEVTEYEQLDAVALPLLDFDGAVEVRLLVAPAFLDLAFDHPIVRRVDVLVEQLPTIGCLLISIGTCVQFRSIH
jgi:hypothetical protein